MSRNMFKLFRDKIVSALSNLDKEDINIESKAKTSDENNRQVIEHR